MTVYAEMRRVKELGRRLMDIADAVAESYEEVHEQGHWSGAGGSITQMHRANGSDNDPTPQAVSSGSKAALRARALEVTRMVRRELEPPLRRVEDYLKTATVKTLDRELKRQLDDADSVVREIERRRRRGA